MIGVFIQRLSVTECTIISTECSKDILCTEKNKIYASKHSVWQLFVFCVFLRARMEHSKTRFQVNVG